MFISHRPPPDEDLLFLSTMSHRVRNCGLLESTVDECNAYHLVRKSINQVSADLGMDEGETKDFVDNSGCSFSFFDLYLVLNTYWDGLSRWRVGQGDALMSVDQRLREITNFEEAKQSQTQRSVLRPVCMQVLAERQV